MNSLAVLTSGGDAPGMNACIRAVVRTALTLSMKVYGIDRGYTGLIEGDFTEMDRSSVSDIIRRGGTILHTSRCEEFKTVEGREKALKRLAAYNIEGLIAIGGDGTFRGADLLSKMGFPVSCIPGTIDNDLPYTDYTIGFDTAVNTVLEAINKIADTAGSHERVSVVEVMGRKCGDIALFSGLDGGAEAIIIPEKSYEINNICRTILENKKKGRLNNLIIVAEGAVEGDGGAKKIAEQIEDITGIEARSTTLGYTQRGGSPSGKDRGLGCKFGYYAVQTISSGVTSSAVGIKNNKVFHMPIEDALKYEKVFDEELYNIFLTLTKNQEGKNAKN